MFVNYAKQYTDMPFVLMLDEDENGYKAGRFLRASDLGIKSKNGEWKNKHITWFIFIKFL
jgi:nitrate reductase alpha subunit